jgi:GT2 family glycosyltransferase
LNRQIDISLIILTYNSARFLGACLSSVTADLAHSKLAYEVIVIDNGSGDGTREILEKFRNDGLPLTVIPLGRNTGTTFSRNIGFRMATGKYLCVLDSDIEFMQQDTLVTLMNVLERDQTTGLIAPMLQYPSGNHQKSFDQFPTVWNKFRRFLWLRKMERVEALAQFEDRGTLEVDYLISAFWLFPRALVDAIGLLDENIFYAPEDADFCLRTWLAGFRVLLCSRVRVTHVAQEISRKGPLSKLGRSHLLGLVYYFKKYRYCFRLKGVRSRIQAAVSLKQRTRATKVS